MVKLKKLELKNGNVCRAEFLGRTKIILHCKGRMFRFNLEHINCKETTAHDINKKCFRY